MSTYASNTSVSSDRSRTEIEKTLTRYGATSFLYGWQDDSAIVAFIAHGRQIRFALPMPDRQNREFTHTPNQNRKRTPGQIEQHYEQAVRQRWRALLLIIKAKLEAVESGIVSFEDEFLPQTVIADNTTVAEWVQPQVDESYATGRMPKMLPQPGRAIESRSS